MTFVIDDAEHRYLLSMLRDICAEWGDNDWDDDLHIVDVVEKHLWRYATEPA